MGIGREGRRASVLIQYFQQSPDTRAAAVSSPRHGRAVMGARLERGCLNRERWSLVARPVFEKARHHDGHPFVSRPSESSAARHTRHAPSPLFCAHLGTAGTTAGNAAASPALLMPTMPRPAGSRRLGSRASSLLPVAADVSRPAPSSPGDSDRQCRESATTTANGGGPGYQVGRAAGPIVASSEGFLPFRRKHVLRWKASGPK
jgi:hypothetical protein